MVIDVLKLHHRLEYWFDWREVNLSFFKQTLNYYHVINLCTTNT